MEEASQSLWAIPNDDSSIQVNPDVLASKNSYRVNERDPVNNPDEVQSVEVDPTLLANEPIYEGCKRDPIDDQDEGHPTGYKIDLVEDSSTIRADEVLATKHNIRSVEVESIILLNELSFKANERYPVEDLNEHLSTKYEGQLVVVEPATLVNERGPIDDLDGVLPTGCKVQSIEVDPAVLAVLPNRCEVQSVEDHGKTNWSSGFKVDVLLPDGDTKVYFMKIVDRDIGDKMVLGEYEGQNALHAIIPNSIPLPVAYGVYALDDTKHFYISEFHQMREKVPKPQQLVPVLKQLHQNSVSPTGQFGFPVTSFKGYFPLQCSWCDSWEEFFNRQFRSELIWEASIRGPNEELEELTEVLFAKVIPRLLRPLQTGGRTIKPTLCHGDLWQGNVEIDVNTQQVMLYDSCAVYAHNEFDLSLFRAPRYLLNKSHVDEYKKEVGISEPIDDFDDRNALYSLRNDIVVSALWDSRTVELREKSIAEMKRLIAKFPLGIDDFKE